MRLGKQEGRKKRCSKKLDRFVSMPGLRCEARGFGMIREEIPVEIGLPEIGAFASDVTAGWDEI
jgi:hypothetical protein